MTATLRKTASALSTRLRRFCVEAVGDAGQLLESALDVVEAALVEAQQLPQQHLAVGEGEEHLGLAALELLGEHHLAGAVEQRHGTHLLEIEPHRVAADVVVGGVDLDLRLLGGEVGLGLLDVRRVVRLRAVDDDDALVREAGVEVLELSRLIEDALGESVVDLVVEQITLPLPALEQLADRVLEHVLGAQLTLGQLLLPMPAGRRR